MIRIRCQKLTVRSGSDPKYYPPLLYSGIWKKNHPGSRSLGVKKHQIPDPVSGSATLLLYNTDFIDLFMAF
jgi:hypothetical protein